MKVFSAFAKKIRNMKAEPTEFILEEIDCIEGMKKLPDGSVDIVVTSPPYNLGIKYRNYQDRKTREEYLAWSCQWAAEVEKK
jgi:DNA modification methylase